ncbi:TPA: phage tail protein [Escherichia coli]|nr:phage tail protein [Escherichia coli]HBA6858307.1 phage tail protein [Escherichia coli]HBA8714628.1 phage tail protein [Escherichia coli]HBA8943626.1 phage tail protein [Escherichia coli]HBA8962257.1 phage tail protein [Escherichia coli]
MDSTKSFFSVLNPLDIYLQYLRKDENGADIPDTDAFAKNIGAARAHSGSISIGGDNSNWTTTQFIDWLDAQGAFNHPYWMVKGSWSYASNKIITDTGCGNIQLAGAVVEVMGVKSAMTIRVTTPTTVTNGTAKAQFTYINHGDSYAPGWRRDWNRSGDTMSGELQTTSANALRLISGNYGVIARQDGNNLYLLLTDSGNQYGSWNSLRPLTVSLNTGKVTLGNGVSGNVVATGEVQSNNGNARLAGDGNVYGTLWGGWLSAYLANSVAGVQDVRLGAYIHHTMSRGSMFEYAGYVITGLGIIGEVDGDDPARLRPLQKKINGTWYNVEAI